MKPEIKEGIFESLIWTFDDMQRCKNKIMDRLEKSVTERIEADGLKKWKEKILQQLKNEGKV